MFKKDKQRAYYRQIEAKSMLPLIQVLYLLNYQSF